MNIYNNTDAFSICLHITLRRWKLLYRQDGQRVSHRLWEHQNGVYGGYTSTRRPVTLMWSQPFPTYLDAMAAERQIKTWTRAKKEALIKGDFSLLHELAECKNESHFAKKKK